MDKRKLNRITMAFVVLTVLVVGIMLNHTLRRTTRIVLPEELPAVEEMPGEPTDSGELTVVEILPETVQTAVATLKRPENYSRTVTVENMWSGGSRTWQTVVTAREGFLRTDRTTPDGQLRHTITDGDQTYIWYNEDEDYLTLPAGPVSTDNEQAIPTYEQVLQLPLEQIAEAGYQEVTGLRCIYVETAPDEDGYLLRYWVSVDSGLLVAAEKRLNGVTVYRMGALELNETLPAASLFVLPDGKALL